MAAEKKQDRDMKSLNRDGGREIETDRERQTERGREGEREMGRGERGVNPVSLSWHRSLLSQ